MDRDVGPATALQASRKRLRHGQHLGCLEIQVVGIALVTHAEAPRHPDAGDCHYILNKPEQSKLSKRSIFSSLRASALPTLNLKGETFQISHS